MNPLKIFNNCEASENTPPDIHQDSNKTQFFLKPRERKPLSKISENIKIPEETKENIENRFPKENISSEIKIPKRQFTISGFFWLNDPQKCKDYEIEILTNLLQSEVFLLILY